MRRLYIGPRHNAVRMVSVCGFRPGRGCVCRSRCDGRLLALGPAPLIRILIWSDWLYYLGPVVGHKCILQLLSFYLYGGVVQVGVQLELSLYLGHVVVGQVRWQCYALAL